MRNAINFAGSKVILAFLETIGLSRGLQALSLPKAANAIFPTQRILQYLIIGWLLGCERLFHFKSLQQDALVRHALGGRLPHHTLLNKELLRFGKSHASFLPNLRTLNFDIIAQALLEHSILDLDSSVETVYGHQQGAAVGVNRHKRGRKSYHPLLVFEGKSRLLVNAMLRSGNTSSFTDVFPFAKQTLNLLGERKVSHVRFNKGFGGENFYAFWEAQSIGYVGKLKWTNRLAEQVRACEHWTRFVDDEDWIIEGIVLCNKATTWNKTRRVAVIRKMQRYANDHPQLELDIHWQYEAMVTTEAWEATDVWRFYNQRFRREFIHCAGVLVRSGRQSTLKLAESFQNRWAWVHMERKGILLE